MARKKSQISEQRENIIESSIRDVGRSAYLDIGNYVNNFRHMADIRDGCKVSYRRLIWSSLQFPKGKLIPSVNLISQTANYHAHSLTGIEGLNAVLVNSGIFTGEGSFGYTDITGTVNPYAAPRYTRNRLSDTYYDIIGDLMKYIPKVESPVGALEPEYLPVALPLCLSLHTSVVGLGFGVASQYPCFSPISVYRAYRENNPNLLEPGVDLEIDYKKSDLEGLWRNGKGSVVYKYHMSVGKSPDEKTEGVYLYGDTCIFTPKLSKLKKLIEDGKIFMDDLTDINGPKIFIGRIPGARGISVEDIVEICDKIRSNSIVYNLNVTDSKMTFRIPLFNWIDGTYRNYLSLLNISNQDKINKCRFDIAVQEAIPIIADYIMNQNPKATNEELEKVLGIPQDIIQVVMSKPISSLRKNKDNAEKIKSLKTKLKELKKFDPVIYTEEVISKM